MSLTFLLIKSKPNLQSSICTRELVDKKSSKMKHWDLTEVKNVSLMPGCIQGKSKGRGNCRTELTKLGNKIFNKTLN